MEPTTYIAIGAISMLCVVLLIARVRKILREKRAFDSKFNLMQGNLSMLDKDVRLLMRERHQARTTTRDGAGEGE